MNEIVCATRGGEASRAVQMAAIEKAKSSGNPLVFLYVVSPVAITDIEPGLEEAVYGELLWLGKAVLNVAVERAKNEGLAAEKVIRTGNVRDEMCAFLNERGASVLFLGAPRAATTAVFGDDPVERFASSVHESTGVEVAVVKPDLEDPNSFYAYPILT